MEICTMLQQYYIGQTARLQRVFTEEDVIKSQQLTRDFNPYYDKNSEIWKSHYDKPIVPALLTEGLITEAISHKLPGVPCLLLQKDFVFYSPVHVGDVITAELVIIDINESRGWITQKVICYDQNNNEVIKGQVVNYLLNE